MSKFSGREHFGSNFFLTFNVQIISAQNVREICGLSSKNFRPEMFENKYSKKIEPVFENFRPKKFENFSSQVRKLFGTQCSKNLWPKMFEKLSTRNVQKNFDPEYSIRNVRKKFDLECSKNFRPEMLEQFPPQNIRKIFDPSSKNVRIISDPVY